MRERERGRETHTHTHRTNTQHSLKVQSQTHMLSPCSHIRHTILRTHKAHMSERERERDTHTHTKQTHNTYSRFRHTRTHKYVRERDANTNSTHANTHTHTQQINVEHTQGSDTHTDFSSFLPIPGRMFRGQKIPFLFNPSLRVNAWKHS